MSSSKLSYSLLRASIQPLNRLAEYFAEGKFTFAEYTSQVHVARKELFANLSDMGMPEDLMGAIQEVMEPTQILNAIQQLLSKQVCTMPDGSIFSIKIV